MWPTCRASNVGFSIFTTKVRGVKSGDTVCRSSLPLLSRTERPDYYANKNNGQKALSCSHRVRHGGMLTPSLVTAVVWYSDGRPPCSTTPVFIADTFAQLPVTFLADLSPKDGFPARCVLSTCRSCRSSQDHSRSPGPDTFDTIGNFFIAPAVVPASSAEE